MSNSDKNNVKCDGKAPDNISHGWYRMLGKAGVQIPEECVPTERCGTKAPGWLNGKHPTAHEGVVTREVCYHWGNDCCKWKNNIKIRNCGGYFVYELQKPPTCSLRYCGHIEDVFTKFDKNGDGFISKSELGASSWKALALYDLNSDQKLSRDEFDILLKVSKDVKETNYVNHFRAADTNHDGYVSAQELKQRFTQIGGRPTDMNSVLNVLQKNDQNDDGKLNYKEFKKAFFDI